MQWAGKLSSYVASHHTSFFSKEAKSSDKHDTDSSAGKSDHTSEKSRSFSDKEHKKSDPSTGDKRPAKFDDTLGDFTKRHKTCGRLV